MCQDEKGFARRGGVFTRVLHALHTVGVWGLCQDEKGFARRGGVFTRVFTRVLHVLCTQGWCVYTLRVKNYTLHANPCLYGRLHVTRKSLFMRTSMSINPFLGTCEGEGVRVGMCGCVWPLVMRHAPCCNTEDARTGLAGPSRFRSEV